MEPTPIQAAIKQNKPFAGPGHEAVIGIVLLADRLRRRGERMVAPFGITGQQYNVLRILRGGGKEGVPTLSIADRMIEQTPGITRLLDRLEEKGLVRRERCEADRRQVLCWITDPGLKLLESLASLVRKNEEEALSALKVSEQRELVRLLGLLVAKAAGE